MSPSRRVIAALFASLYDGIGSTLMVSGLVLCLAARAIRSELDGNVERHPDRAAAKNREAVDRHLETERLREMFRRARTAHPDSFGPRVDPFGFAPRRNDPNAN